MKKTTLVYFARRDGKEHSFIEVRCFGKAYSEEASECGDCIAADICKEVYLARATVRDRTIAFEIIMPKKIEEIKNPLCQALLRGVSDLDLLRKEFKLPPEILMKYRDFVYQRYDYLIKEEKKL